MCKVSALLPMVAITLIVSQAFAQGGSQKEGLFE
jgi:hypothetical protein